MQIGKLDQQITFQTLVETNVSGGITKSWASTSPPDTVWAHVISERGSESFQSSRIDASETIRILVHYRADVTDKWRLLWNGNYYYIKYIDRSQRRDGELWMTAVAKGIE